MIKEVRSLLKLGLKESKELVEKSPVVLMEDCPKEDAENIKKVVQWTDAFVSHEINKNGGGGLPNLQTSSDPISSITTQNLRFFIMRGPPVHSDERARS